MGIAIDHMNRSMSDIVRTARGKSLLWRVASFQSKNIDIGVAICAATVGAVVAFSLASNAHEFEAAFATGLLIYFAGSLNQIFFERKGSYLKAAVWGDSGLKNIMSDVELNIKNSNKLLELMGLDKSFQSGVIEDKQALFAVAAWYGLLTHFADKHMQDSWTGKYSFQELLRQGHRDGQGVSIGNRYYDLPAMIDEKAMAPFIAHIGHNPKAVDILALIEPFRPIPDYLVEGLAIEWDQSALSSDHLTAACSWLSSHGHRGIHDWLQRHAMSGSRMAASIIEQLARDGHALALDSIETLVEIEDPQLLRS